MKPEEARLSKGQAGKLCGKVALINDAHNSIGLAVAALFAQEGADIAISCSHGREIQRTHRAVEQKTKKPLLLSGDSADIAYCIDAVERTLFEYGSLDILVNNTAALEFPEYSAGNTADPPEDQFSDSLASTLFMTQSALFYLAEGGSIINTIPIAQEPIPRISDYVAARLSLTNFTQTLAKELAPKQIRVNGVGLGSLSASFPQEEISPGKYGSEPDHKARAEEIAPSYLFLASRDCSQMTGQVLYPSNS